MAHPFGCVIFFYDIFLISKNNLILLLLKGERKIIVYKVFKGIDLYYLLLKNNNTFADF